MLSLHHASLFPYTRLTTHYTHTHAPSIIPHRSTSMPLLKSHSGSSGLLLSHGSGSSRSSLASKLLLLGMGGCALLAAVYLPGRETVDVSGSGGAGDLRASMGVSALVAGACVRRERGMG